jgi:hypothetical protein
MLAHSEDEGSFKANTVLIKDASGNLLRRIDFSGSQPYALSDTSPAGYWQDHWAMIPSFALDLGTRFESQSITHTVRYAPRAGFIWTPDKAQKIRVRGGAGIFFDSVPLDMYAFAYYPEQTITTYDSTGGVVGTPVTYLNLTSQSAQNSSPFVGRKEVSGNFAPYSVAWNVEIERVFNPTLVMRLKYLQSAANSVLRIDRETVDGYPAYVLNSNGSAHTRQLELTAQIGASARRRLFASYVYQHAFGLVNDATGYLGDVSYPVIRSNFYGHLPSEVPHRLMAWGTYDLPWQFHIMPKFEYRTGFPYLATDVGQDFLSNGAQKRFPNYLSADVRIAKDIKVSQKHAIRLSTTIRNITNHFNALEVHSNTGDPLYGQFFGSVDRKYTIDFDFLY